jgi:hypothetical protein
MAAKAKKSERLGRSAKLKRRSAKLKKVLMELAFERPVIYRGIKIKPIAGRRSSLARAIRDDLRKQSEQSRRKSA